MLQASHMYHRGIQHSRNPFIVVLLLLSPDFVQACGTSATTRPGGVLFGFVADGTCLPIPHWSWWPALADTLGLSRDAAAPYQCILVWLSLSIIICHAMVLPLLLQIHSFFFFFFSSFFKLLFFVLFGGGGVVCFLCPLISCPLSKWLYCLLFFSVFTLSLGR